MDFEGFYEALYVTNVLDLQRFETETTTVLDFFEICMEIFFFSK